MTSCDTKVFCCVADLQTLCQMLAHNSMTKICFVKAAQTQKMLARNVSRKVLLPGVGGSRPLSLHKGVCSATSKMLNLSM